MMIFTEILVFSSDVDSSNYKFNQLVFHWTKKSGAQTIM